MSCVKFLLYLSLEATTSLAFANYPVCDGRATAQLPKLVLQNMRASRAEFGLDAFSDFQIKDVIGDQLGQTHVRLQQTYRGLPVWGAQAIVHVDAKGVELPMTDALVRNLRLETTPNLGPGEALAVAQERVAPKGPYTDPPDSQLVIWPKSPLLAYHLHLELENGGEETRHQDLLVDAHTGAVVKAWSTLLTSRRRPRKTTAGKPAEGTGNSQYSGQVVLGLQRTSKGFELSDPGRGGFTTRNMGGQTAGSGEPYVNETATWGDGQNYDPGRGPTSPNGQTTAVDAHYGVQVTWDFYKNILGREGPDGKGTPIANLVHYSTDFKNAFWNDRCFCMTFGDSPEVKSLTSLEVVGHEVSHGLCHTTADLSYSGESGGLNEASSDIFGTLIRMYARGASGAGDTVPDKGGPWFMGDQILPTPFRYLIKPSLDGESPDEWSEGLKWLDVHNSSGPMNRAFYFLSQGASADKASDAYTRRLPKGMKGIGNDKAIRVWWRTLSTRLTPESGYAEARSGALQSARDLYGAGSAEEEAVANAFKGINVGGTKADPSMKGHGQKRRKEPHKRRNPAAMELPDPQEENP